jgi:hypothetical protein
MNPSFTQREASSVEQFRMILISKENIKRYERQAIKYLTFKDMGLYKSKQKG